MVTIANTDAADRRPTSAPVHKWNDHRHGPFETCYGTGTAPKRRHPDDHGGARLL
jgi:hypothetical protein